MTTFILSSIVYASTYVVTAQANLTPIGRWQSVALAAMVLIGADVR